ncbi:MAG: heme-binding protein [Mailhella sp.]
MSKSFCRSIALSAMICFMSTAIPFSLSTQPASNLPPASYGTVFPYDNESVQAALAYFAKSCTEDRGKPVAIAIYDADANPVAVFRLHNALERFARFAMNKAYTSAVMRVDSREIGKRVASGQVSLDAFCDRKMTSMTGGVALTDKEGRFMGAIGVSGRTGAEDEQIAKNVAEFLKNLL